MSPVSPQRYLVSVTDFAVYEIIVEAMSRNHAIHKAKRIYRLNGLAENDAFEHSHSNAGHWHAEPLVREAVA